MPLSPGCVTIFVSSSMRRSRSPRLTILSHPGHLLRASTSFATSCARRAHEAQAHDCSSDNRDCRGPELGADTG